MGWGFASVTSHDVFVAETVPLKDKNQKLMSVNSLGSSGMSSHGQLFNVNNENSFSWNGNPTYLIPVLKFISRTLR